MTARFIRKSKPVSGQIEQPAHAAPAPPPRGKTGVVTWQAAAIIIAGMGYSLALVLLGITPEQAATTTVWTVGLLLAVVVSGSPLIALGQEIGRRIGTPRPEQRGSS
ncbi:hypothetical protein [Nocardia salmonicida]|uniref:hypothetical protein n=1 Tax=Nocardia salmonicida TaxID=53431 RepID=UPI003631DFF5